MNEEEFLTLLSSGPEYTLPPSFASKVTGRVEKKVLRTKNLRYYIGTAGAIVVCLLGAFGLLSVISMSAGSEFLHILNTRKWIFVFFCSSLLIIQYADQKIKDLSL